MASSDPSGSKILNTLRGYQSALAKTTAEIVRQTKAVHELKAAWAGFAKAQHLSGPVRHNGGDLNLGQGGPTGMKTANTVTGLFAPGHLGDSMKNATKMGTTTHQGQKFVQMALGSFTNIKHPTSGSGGGGGKGAAPTATPGDNGGSNWMQRASSIGQGMSKAVEKGSQGKGVIGFINSQLPTTDEAVARAEAMWVARQNWGGSGQAAVTARLGVQNSMKFGMLNPNDDARVTTAISSNVGQYMAPKIGELSSYMGARFGMDAVQAGKGIASMYSGASSASLARMGMFTTGGDGKRKDPKAMAMEFYNRSHANNFKTLDSLIESMDAGIVSLMFQGLDGDAVEVIKKEMIAIYQDKHGGSKTGDWNTTDPSTAEWNKDSPIGGRMERAAAKTHQVEGSMDKRVAGYNLTQEAEAAWVNTVTNVTEALGPFGDAINYAKGVLDGGVGTQFFEAMKSLIGMIPTPSGGSGLGSSSGLAKKGGVAGVIASGAKGSAVQAASSGSASGGSGILKGSSAAVSSTLLPGVVAGRTAALGPAPGGGTAGGTAGGGTAGGGSTEPSPSGGKGARFVWDQLIAKGFSPAGAAAVLGNIEMESGFNPHASGDNGTAHGIIQWRGDRWANLQKFAKQTKRSPWDLGLEVDFMVKELGSYKSLLRMLKDPKTDAAAAARRFDAEYERSDGSVRERRAKAAQGYLKRYGSHSEGAWDVPRDQEARIHSGEMVLPAELAHSVREVLAGKRAGGGGNGGVVNVNVTLNNASRPEAERLVRIVASEIDKNHRQSALART